MSVAHNHIAVGEFARPEEHLLTFRHISSRYLQHRFLLLLALIRGAEMFRPMPVGLCAKACPWR